MDFAGDRVATTPLVINGVVFARCTWPPRMGRSMRSVFRWSAT